MNWLMLPIYVLAVFAVLSVSLVILAAAAVALGCEWCAARLERLAALVIGGGLRR